jgi:hypothetical protein
MAISVNVARPKLVGTTTFSPDIIAKPLVENVTNFEIPICYDNLSNTPVDLTDISFTTGSPTITGLAPELAKVKIGSVIITDEDTTDFASGTYVTAKPTPTTLTVSTNALDTKENTTGEASLTVDATAVILRIIPVGSTNSANIRLDIYASIMSGANATDSNGNGYDEVSYSAGNNRIVGTISLDFDSFATAFGLNRVN